MSSVTAPRRGRPAKPLIEFYPGPAPEMPERPSRDYVEAGNQFRTVLELWGRANLHENRRKGRTVLDGDLVQYAANWIAVAETERGTGADIARLLLAACPDHVNADAIRRRLAQLRPPVQSQTDLVQWPPAKVDYVLASFYFGRARLRFLKAKGIDRDRAVLELGLLLTALRLEYAVAKAARTSPYRKAEDRVLSDKDRPPAPELGYSEPRKPSLRKQTGGRMLKYEFARAIWKFSTAPDGLAAMTPEERIELAYILAVAADRVATAIRRDDSEPASLVDPEWERIPIAANLNSGYGLAGEFNDAESGEGVLYTGSVLDELLSEEAEELEAFENGVGDW